MAEIRKLLWLRHLRAEATSFVLQYKAGELRRAGQGLAFWFNPLNAAVAEVPVDDRDLNFLFKGRTRDYQEVTAQGVVSYRVTDPEKLARRVDFGVDLDTGAHARQPLEQIAVLLTGIAQQTSLQIISREPLQQLVVDGFDEVVGALERTMAAHPTLTELGLAVENVRIDELKPNPDLERALQAPTREGLQQRADEATFQRRALAVEKERAIAENELQTQVELAKRQERLIEQQGANGRRQIEQEAEARRLGVLATAEDQRIRASAEAEEKRLEAEARAQRKRVLAAAEAEELTIQGKATAENQRLEGTVLAERTRLEAEAQADQVRAIGSAKAETARLEGLAQADRVRAIGEAKAAGEQQRLDAYRSLPPDAVFALALQELAGQLKIEHLTVTPDMLAGLMEKAGRLALTKLESREQ